MANAPSSSRRGCRGRILPAARGTRGRRSRAAKNMIRPKALSADVGPGPWRKDGPGLGQLQPAVGGSDQAGRRRRRPRPVRRPCERPGPRRRQRPSRRHPPRRSVPRRRKAPAPRTEVIQGGSDQMGRTRPGGGHTLGPPTTLDGLPLMLTITEAAKMLRPSRSSADKAAEEHRATGAHGAADAEDRRPADGAARQLGRHGRGRALPGTGSSGRGPSDASGEGGGDADLALLDLLGVDAEEGAGRVTEAGGNRNGSWPSRRAVPAAQWSQRLCRPPETVSAPRPRPSPEAGGRESLCFPTRSASRTGPWR